MLISSMIKKAIRWLTAPENEPNSLFLMWLFIIHVIAFVMVALQHIIYSPFVVLSFILCAPIALIIFPSIIISIKSSSYKNSIVNIKVDAREIVVPEVPAQLRVSCFRRSNYHIIVTADGKVYPTKEARLYESMVHSIEIEIE